MAEQVTDIEQAKKIVNEFRPTCQGCGCSDWGVSDVASRPDMIRAKLACIHCGSIVFLAKSFRPLTLCPSTPSR